MSENEKLYKVYHRNYKTIEELYDDLSDTVLNICFKNNRVIVHYKSDTLEIEEFRHEYYTYLNGERQKEEWEDQDIYYYVLSFVHEERKGVSELEICDTCITDINDSGITYVDELCRKHFVNYELCAVNGPGMACVAERDITKRYFKFYTSEVPLKILFKNLFVFKKEKRFLAGSRGARFKALQQAAVDSGYTTRDLS